MFIRVARAAHNMKHVSDDVEFEEESFTDSMREALYNTKRNVRKRQLVLSQRMVNYLGAPVSSPAKRPRPRREAVSYTFDHRGTLTAASAREDAAADNSEPTLYEAVMNVVKNPQSVDELDDLLQDLIVVYQEEPVDTQAQNVLQSVRTAIASAAQDENKAGIIERFKSELEEFQTRKLRT